MSEINLQRAPLSSALGPLPAFSKLAISMRLALYGRDDARVQYMAERNQMLKLMREHGFVAPVVPA